MKASSSGGKLPIDVWEIVQYYYCPRKIYFLRTLGVPVVQKRKMAMGQDEHLKEIKRLKERQSVFGFRKSDVEEIYQKLALEDAELGLAGQIDTVIKLKNGKIMPVELKYSDYVAAFRSRKKQLTAYAILLERKFNQIIDTGILYFPIQNKQVTVSITYEDKKNLLADLEKIRQLILSEKIPRKSQSEKCRYCEATRYCG
ncbi:CRISPR-associated protein Cas4 [Candidatus Hecatella orcuttiae]|jgi:CRISPR-associated exonuclease Cas4|uniref:CRISPR-associated protein Cas4 n=1 Tax=Candidatus Hecatella orcuttiae TaxID=1935119 RepID=UPI002868367B|nr:CRISPR-associated protein Cas4 [Candidatus Hecatella orcuttiae]